MVIVENNSRGDVVNFGARLGSPPAINKKRAETQVLAADVSRAVRGYFQGSLLVALIVWSLSAGFFPAAYADLPTATYIWMGVLAAIGLQRFPDVFARMHAATKPVTLGLALAWALPGLRAYEPSARPDPSLLALPIALLGRNESSHGTAVLGASSADRGRNYGGRFYTTKEQDFFGDKWELDLKAKAALPAGK